MTTIFDRCRIDRHSLPQVRNVRAHSSEVASIAVRVAAATYALTSSIDPASKGATETGRDIPFSSLKAHLESGVGMSADDWFGPDMVRESFAVAVSGGAVYGVRLGDILFVGFRGTTNVADWSINLFGVGHAGPAKCPGGRREEYFDGFRHYRRDVPEDVDDAQVHAGFYRVSQALSSAVVDELGKLWERDRALHNHNPPRVVLTGHSLGGALALLAGLRIDHHAVYTFGMPRVCGGGFVQWLPPCHYRYVLEGDPVPLMPFESLGFRHDMPSLKLSRGLEKPSLFARAIRGFKDGTTLSGSVGAAARAILASEHDMEAYVSTIVAQEP